jgi:hypothetical protein
MAIVCAEIEQFGGRASESFDATGKAVLNSIYNRPDPRAYWRTLSALDYRVPEEAKPYFQRAISARREQTGSSYFGSIVDLGCSYGVNSMLLRFGLGIRDLHRRYAAEEVSLLDRAALIARDRRLERCRDFGERAGAAPFVGIDVSPHAAAYATEALLMDDVVVADLEQRPLEPDEAHRIAGAALIISTGCFGYVTATSLTRIVLACDRQPWMMHTVLRMFDFGPVEEALAQRGYVSVRSPRLLKQRRFACRREQEQILDRLSANGVDATGLEANGWLYAYFVLSRPASHPGSASACRIFPS